MDGHGIYAELDTDGNEPIDMNECRGHYDDTRGYHYYTLQIGSNEFFDCMYGAYAVTEDEGMNAGGRPN